MIPIHDDNADIIDLHRNEMPERIVTSFWYYTKDDLETIVVFYQSVIEDETWEIISEDIADNSHIFKLEKDVFTGFIVIRETGINCPDEYDWRIRIEIIEEIEDIKTDDS